MNQERLKWIFVVLVSLSGVWLILKLIPPLPMGQKIAMTVIKQKGSIANLDTPRKVDFTKHFWVDTIDFKEGKVLEHHKWGNYGFQNDFFMEFEVGFVTHKVQDYEFKVASDDGFRLWIDGVKIGEYLNNRPFSSNVFAVRIQPGKHRYKLLYYQGFGLQGLRTDFRKKGKKKFVLIGKNAYGISFIKVKKNK